MGVTKSGSIVVSFMTREGNATNLNFARSTDEGASWTNKVVDQVGGNFIVPCVSAFSDRVWVSYLDFNAGALLKARWSDDDGETWAKADVKTLTNLPVVQPPSCMARGSSVHVAFPYVKNLQSQEQPGDEYHVVKFDGTGSPTEVTASDAAGKFAYLGLMVPEEIPGAMSMLYYTGKKNPDPAGSLRMTRSTDDGATWSESIQVSKSVIFTTNRAGGEWLGDYLGAAQLGNEVLVAYGDNSKVSFGQNLTHISFVKVSRP
jgi:hypothetical protein